MGGAPAARGCSIERGRRLHGGSSRCAGLLNRERKEAAMRGSPAAGGSLIERGRRLLGGELPLRGAAQ